MRIVIDTRVISNGLRRAWWSLWKHLRRIPTERGACIDCGDDLTPDEAHFYGHTCEMCEGIRMIGNAP